MKGVPLIVDPTLRKLPHDVNLQLALPNNNDFKNLAVLLPPEEGKTNH